MTLVVRLLACGLAAFWLPLTLHCHLARLKNCGELSLCCENHCGCSGSGDCPSDVCKIIESGKYITTKALLAVPAAAFVWLEAPRPVDGRRWLTPMTILTAATGAPPGWTRVWQFVCRAAPAPRAPSAACC